MHFAEHRLRIDIGRAEQHFQRPRGAAPFAQRRAFQHHRARIGARHVDVGSVGRRVDPDAVGGPAEPLAFGLPPVHRDDAVIDVEPEMVDEPVAHLTQSQPVAHHHRPCADEAFLPRHQQRAFHRAPRRIGPVEHPHGLAVLRAFFEEVEQRGDEGVDAAAQILQVEQEHVRARHHLPGGAAHLAIEAEYGDIVGGIGLVRRLHHIILLVALQPVLRAECAGDIDPRCDQRIEAVLQIPGDRRRMGDQCDSLAFERPA